MSITRWDPLRDFVSLRDAVDHLLEDSVIRPSATRDGGVNAFPVDLYETADAFVMKASLPGVTPDRLEISATQDSAVVRAEVRQDTTVKDEAWLRQERRFGTFQRGFTFPVPIDPDRVEATFEHGVLTLTLPKAETVRPKRIRVKTGGEAIEARGR